MRVLRFIPAGAGNTLNQTRWYRPTSVHPRWRGEHVEVVAQDDRDVRFIPAGAGNTYVTPPIANRSSVHPRWRGEHRGNPHAGPYTVGSSPLARGTRSRQRGRLSSWRFIPAGAGNTVFRAVHCFPFSVHPRWRGEHAARAFPSARSQSVHPRWRGEHSEITQLFSSSDGSSPLARGTHPESRAAPPGTAVHPRWRGEHCRMIFKRGSTCGSSPLARGTPAPPAHASGAIRFIPAGAGNTSAFLEQNEGFPVHPRWRGEHRRTATVRSAIRGSSPLARGTPKNRRRR